LHDSVLEEYFYQRCCSTDSILLVFYFYYQLPTVNFLLSTILNHFVCGSPRRFLSGEDQYTINSLNHKS